MKEAIFSNPLFGIVISVVSFKIGMMINEKTKTAAANPLLISYVLIISFLIAFDIPLSWYNKGGDIINMFLSPATAVLALTIYRQRELIKSNFLPIFAGTLAGSAASLLSVYLLCRLFTLDSVITASILPKSITTPMALAVSSSLGGIQAVTVLCVIITGVAGNILAPILVKLFRTEDPVVQGVAIGTCSHAIGTSRAVTMGEIQGAVSSVALTFTGVITVVFSLFLGNLV